MFFGFGECKAELPLAAVIGNQENADFADGPLCLAGTVG